LFLRFGLRLKNIVSQKVYDINFRHILLTRLDKALVLQSQVAKLDRPSSRVIETFRIWFDGGKRKYGGPKPDPVLGGQAKYVLDNEQDLAALKTPADDDFLSRFLQDHWPFTVSAESTFILPVGLNTHLPSRAATLEIIEIGPAIIRSAT
jgi:hypothetical protein